jgi:hypothetical protein
VLKLLIRAIRQGKEIRNKRDTKRKRRNEIIPFANTVTINLKDP